MSLIIGFIYIEILCGEIQYKNYLESKGLLSNNNVIRNMRNMKLKDDSICEESLKETTRI